MHSLKLGHFHRMQATTKALAPKCLLASENFDILRILPVWLNIYSDGFLVKQYLTSLERISWNYCPWNCYSVIFILFPATYRCLHLENFKDMQNALKIWVILKFIELEVKFSNINMTYSIYAVESTYTGAYMYEFIWTGVF